MLINAAADSVLSLVEEDEQFGFVVLDLSQLIGQSVCNEVFKTIQEYIKEYDIKEDSDLTNSIDTD